LTTNSLITTSEVKTGLYYELFAKEDELEFPEKKDNDYTGL
jgi:hypothetical protein